MVKRIDAAVLVGDDEGDAPSMEDEVSFLRRVVIHRSAGARQLDYATCEYDLGETGERLVDLQTPTEWARQVEIRRYTEDQEVHGLPLFIGDLVRQDMRIDDSGERVIVTAALAPYHFGEPLSGMEVRHVAGDDDQAPTTIEQDIVFNPRDERGIVVGNRSEHEFEDEDNELRKYYRWVDLDSIRTPGGQGTQFDKGADWTLPDVINTLCWVLNPDETFVKNPEREDLDGPLLLAAPDVKNLRLARGARLPDYLDTILTPIGYDWFIKYATNDDGESERRITIFKRGDGTEKQLYMQKPGEALKPAKSNVPELAVETSISELANKIVGFGALVEREITLRLYPGWPETEDELKAGELDRTSETSIFAAHQNAWRLWIGNEAGDSERSDTVNTRPEFHSETPAEDVLGENYVIRRRRLDDCLSRDQKGERRPPFLQYSIDAGATWLDAPEVWQPMILTDQIGVYFRGDIPPAELQQTGLVDVRLRITGTITGDQRVQHESTSEEGQSPNARLVTLHLDLSDRFFDRQVIRAGTFASVLGSNPDERDDSSELENYIEQLREVSDAATVRADFVLFGIHFEYEIGDLLTKVEGRNISFNRHSEEAEIKRYLEISGVVWDFDNQTTRLITRPVEDEIDFGTEESTG